MIVHEPPADHKRERSRRERREVPIGCRREASINHTLRDVHEPAELDNYSEIVNVFK